MKHFSLLFFINALGVLAIPDPNFTAAQNLKQRVTDRANRLAASSDQCNVTDYVNLYIGTSRAANTTEKDLSFNYGGAYPGAQVPFGMVNIGPDVNRTQNNWMDDWIVTGGYYYENPQLEDFSVTHIGGAGCWGIAGIFPMMPCSDNTCTDLPRPKYYHDYEYAQPGYYGVWLEDSNLVVETTATRRLALARITPGDSTTTEITVFFKANLTGVYHDWDDQDGDEDVPGTHPLIPGTVNVPSPDRIVMTTGDSRFCSMEPGNEAHGVWTWPDAKLKTWTIFRGTDTFVDTTTDTGDVIRATFDVSASGNKLVLLAAISAVSDANAVLNLQEDGACDLATDLTTCHVKFDQVASDANATWTEYLETIKVESVKTDDTVKFYSAWYRSLMAPTLYSDVNGEYLLPSNGTANINVDGGLDQYTYFSNWDTYRALIQLQSWLFPTIGSSILQSHLRLAKDCGAIPHWVAGPEDKGIMSGDSGALLVTNGYAFGATGIDKDAAIKYLNQSSLEPTSRCQSVSSMGDQCTRNNYYWDLGYCDSDLSTTLENQIRDYATGVFMDSVSRSDISHLFYDLSKNWISLYNNQTNSLMPRNATDGGTWITDRSTGYQEGSPEQYDFYPVHDWKNLILTYGYENAVAKLNAVFNMSQLSSGHTANVTTVNVGNEPDMNMPFIFNFGLNDSKAQDVIQTLRDNYYLNEKGGIPGNDDLGAMSAWVVWTSLGFYPIMPGTGGVTLCNPMFPVANVTLPNKEVLTIIATNAQVNDNRFVKSVQECDVGKSNAVPISIGISPTWINISDLNKAPTIQFQMTNNLDDLQDYGSPNILSFGLCTQSGTTSNIVMFSLSAMFVIWTLFSMF